MSRKYKNTNEVPSEALVSRLNEIADSCTKGEKEILRTFVMRIPAEVDYDPDLVISGAANRIESLEQTLSRTKAKLAEAVSLLRSTTSLINQLYNFDSGGYEDFEEMVAVGKLDNKIKAFLSSQPNESSED